jgi:hypothetical protein
MDPYLIECVRRLEKAGGATLTRTQAEILHYVCRAGNPNQREMRAQHLRLTRLLCISARQLSYQKDVLQKKLRVATREDVVRVGRSLGFGCAEPSEITKVA